MARQDSLQYNNTGGSLRKKTVSKKPKKVLVGGVVSGYAKVYPEPTPPPSAMRTATTSALRTPPPSAMRTATTSALRTPTPSAMRTATTSALRTVAKTARLLMTPSSVSNKIAPIPTPIENTGGGKKPTKKISKPNQKSPKNKPRKI